MNVATSYPVVKSGPCMILGSASVRRRRLLSDTGVRFEVLVPGETGVPEALHENDPRRTVMENAQLKNRQCRAIRSDLPLLTADTVVVFHGKCITKPSSREHAVELLKMFSGAVQQVLTAVAWYQPGREVKCDVVESTVIFKTLTDNIIAAYFGLVDPMDKAGAYDIDQHGDMIIEKYEGSYTNIVGLPMELVTRWLREADIL